MIQVYFRPEHNYKDLTPKTIICFFILYTIYCEYDNLIDLQTHLFCFSGTLTVEQIYQDRESFATLVREVAAPDVGKMGIEILSFVIKDVVDNVDYLSSIGRAQSAVVKKDAAIGVAEAERDSGIVVGVFDCMTCFYAFLLVIKSLRYINLSRFHASFISIYIYCPVCQNQTLCTVSDVYL